MAVRLTESRLPFQEKGLYKACDLGGLSTQSDNGVFVLVSYYKKVFRSTINTYVFFITDYVANENSESSGEPYEYRWKIVYKRGEKEFVLKLNPTGNGKVVDILDSSSSNDLFSCTTSIGVLNFVFPNSADVLNTEIKYTPGGANEKYDKIIKNHEYLLGIGHISVSAQVIDIKTKNPINNGSLAINNIEVSDNLPEAEVFSNELLFSGGALMGNKALVKVIANLLREYIFENNKSNNSAFLLVTLLHNILPHEENEEMILKKINEEIENIAYYINSGITSFNYRAKIGFSQMSIFSLIELKSEILFHKDYNLPDGTNEAFNNFQAYEGQIQEEEDNLHKKLTLTQIIDLFNLLRFPGPSIKAALLLLESLDDYIQCLLNYYLGFKASIEDVISNNEPIMNDAFAFTNAIKKQIESPIMAIAYLFPPKDQLKEQIIVISNPSPKQRRVFELQLYRKYMFIKHTTTFQCYEESPMKDETSIVINANQILCVLDYKEGCGLENFNWVDSDSYIDFDYAKINYNGKEIWALVRNGNIVYAEIVDILSTVWKVVESEDTSFSISYYGEPTMCQFRVIFDNTYYNFDSDWFIPSLDSSEVHRFNLNKINDINKEKINVETIKRIFKVFNDYKYKDGSSGDEKRNTAKFPQFNFFVIGKYPDGKYMLDQSIAGPRVNDCSTFTCGLLIPSAFHSIKNFVWNLQCSNRFQNIGATKDNRMETYIDLTNDPKSANTLNPIGEISQIYEKTTNKDIKKVNDSSNPDNWALLQTYTNLQDQSNVLAGHSQIIVGYHAGTDRVLILESAASGGVQFRSFGKERYYIDENGEKHQDNRPSKTVIFSYNGFRLPKKWWKWPDLPKWSSIKTRCRVMVKLYIYNLDPNSTGPKTLM